MLSSCLSAAMTVFSMASPPCDAVDATLQRNIGAMLVVGFDGTTPGSAGVRRLKAQAEAGDVGGVVLSSYNIESPESTPS